MKYKSWKEFPIGNVIPEPATSLEYKTGKWRTFKPVINQEKCVKCLLCWVSCPEPAIIRHDDDTVAIDYDFCKGCGICANVCPVKAISMIPEEV